MSDCDIGAGRGIFRPMPREKKLPDDIFVRMPDGTKRLMERLSGSSPAPSAWLRKFLIGALRQEAEKRGMDDPFPEEDR